ncbi:DotI/IcmL/TraM family protein [Alcanivorax sp. 1008]|uniref:DotI/IcmL/TraM family protein n=1 Tax=Alcanivorax sp. 1008 TaxID=2816853 RepID=UPI001DAF6AA6|nr:DotI/IcmL/TraM family protein [Alcanivorax sp. 1008]MCC1496703.1 DotI/IcmL/TraM family protein [Alcanivorax sp. 1008]
MTKKALGDDQALFNEREIRTLQGVNRALMVAVIVLAVLVGVLGIAVWGAGALKPAPQYVGITNDLRFVELSAETDPVLQDAQITAFAARAIQSCLAFDFANYRDQILACTQRHFTAEGERAFLQAMTSSGTIELLKNERRVSRAVIKGVPVISRKGSRGTVYAWEVTVPLTHELANNADTQRRERIARILIVRDNTKALHEGVGVTQFNMEIDRGK